jgi:hypothetical protein
VPDTTHGLLDNSCCLHRITPVSSLVGGPRRDDCLSLDRGTSNGCVRGPLIWRIHATCLVVRSYDHAFRVHTRQRSHFEKTGGRRLEGSTVDDLGRGLDVPPGSRVCARVHGYGPGQGRSPHECRGCGSDVRLQGGLARAVESSGAPRSREMPPWHDASSDAAPIGGPAGNSSIEPSNCSAPCPASRFGP